VIVSFLNHALERLGSEGQNTSENRNITFKIVLTFALKKTLTYGSFKFLI
jgi:hypothetical protein